MKIAVTYENGEVFQHFGHTETFKVYEVEDGKVVSSQIVGSDGSGHEALAVLLADKAIDVLDEEGLLRVASVVDKADRKAEILKTAVQKYHSDRALFNLGALMLDDERPILKKSNFLSFFSP